MISKLALLKKAGGIALKMAGAASGNDKVRALEAEVELLTLRNAVMRQALDDLVTAVGRSHEAAVHEVVETLQVIDILDGNRWV